MPIHNRILIQALATTALAGALGLLPATAALAQTRAAGGAATVSELIVTATKSETALMKTPLAVSAYTGDTLKAQGVVSVSDLQNITPALVVGRTAFGVNIAIRGVTTTDNTSKGDQGIAFNVDGIPVGRPVQEGLAFFDVARVEVLRGPQGTLYGKSSTGGAINVVTNRPKRDFEASADAEAGNFSTFRGSAMVNAPVTDNLAVRLALTANRSRGYLEQKVGPYTGSAKNDQNDVAGRFSALLDVSPKVSAYLAVTGGHVGGVGPGNAVMRFVFDKSGPDQRKVYGNPFSTSANETFANINGELNADLGFLHFTYDGGRLFLQQHDLSSSTNDPVGNGGGGGNYNWRDYRGHFQTDSHEVRLSNSEPGRIDFVLGANWYKERIRESDHNWSAPIATPTVAASNNGIDPVNLTTHESYGVFGQATVHLTDILGLVVGLRRGHDELIRKGTFAAGPRDAAGNVCKPYADCIGGRNDGSQSADKTTYRLGINAQVTPTQMVYASVATGYKAGGFNDFGPLGVPAPYIPEDMIAYEGGYKGLLAPTLQLTSALFYYDYNSEQISSNVVVNGSNVITTRGAPTVIYGWENEFTWRLSDADTLDGSLMLERSYYKTFFARPQQNVNWSNDSLDRTPELVASLGYSHVWDLGDRGSVKMRVQTRYSSSYLLSDFNNALHYTQEDFTRTDATVTYTAADQRFYVEGFVRNIEDNIQATGGGGGFSVNTIYGQTVAVNTPRRFGVRLGYKY